MIYYLLTVLASLTSGLIVGFSLRAYYHRQAILARLFRNLGKH